jgi:uncharacterized membrane protein HdeD (DUF308 family)
LRKEILIPAIGWIISGVISLVVWVIERNRTNNSGLLYIGIFVIIIGIALLFTSKKIAKIMDDAKRKSSG